MNITVALLNHQYQINTDFSWSLAIPVYFNQSEKQPNHFGANAAQSAVMQAGSFIGDTEQGGSCNVNVLTINPHCNGTHTETIAHICDLNAELSLKIVDLQLPPLMPCTVISIIPEHALASGDDYTPAFDKADKIISRRALEKSLSSVDNEQLQSLVIRTLPNNNNKCQQAYDQNNQPAFFSREAILYLNERGIEHIIVDIPSVDRLHDDGLMTCHHLFWQVIEGAHQASPNSQINKTITEMAFINDAINDGFYFINLQTPAFVNDAAPSRPVLYQAIEITASAQKTNNTI
ncbi:MAG: kynurenine formamidase [Alteromonadaceae bacterium]